MPFSLSMFKKLFHSDHGVRSEEEIQLHTNTVEQVHNGKTFSAGFSLVLSLHYCNSVFLLCTYSAVFLCYCFRAAPNSFVFFFQVALYSTDQDGSDSPRSSLNNSLSDQSLASVNLNSVGSVHNYTPVSLGEVKFFYLISI